MECPPPMLGASSEGFFSTGCLARPGWYRLSRQRIAVAGNDACCCAAGRRHVVCQRLCVAQHVVQHLRVHATFGESAVTPSPSSSAARGRNGFQHHDMAGNPEGALFNFARGAQNGRVVECRLVVFGGLFLPSMPYAGPCLILPPLVREKGDRTSHDTLTLHKTALPGWRGPRRHHAAWSVISHRMWEADLPDRATRLASSPARHAAGG